MADNSAETRIVSASREIAAPASEIFELIADPAQQVRWDGNDNLAEAPAGQRISRTGEVFTMAITSGAIRHNRVVEFVEGRLIAWLPAEPDHEPPGHLWRWEIEAVSETVSRVIHTYDWSRLNDPKRLVRARATTSDKLRASVDNLARLAENR